MYSTLHINILKASSWQASASVIAHQQPLLPYHHHRRSTDRPSSSASSLYHYLIRYETLQWWKLFRAVEGPIVRVFEFVLEF